MNDTLIQFQITSIKQETALAKTYELKPLNRKNLIFKPGQFLTFLINTGKQEIRRSYSLLSLPGEPVKITIKKVENGAISRYILQNWQEGEVIFSLEPAGRFTLESQTGKPRDIFCFAAGSGIIPILPQIRHLLLTEELETIHLIYSNHNEADTLFLEEIEALDQQFTGLQVTYIFSNPVTRLKEQGRLSNISVELLVQEKLRHEKEDAVFLLCGPFSYMRMLNFALVLMHFPKKNIRREYFLPEVMRAGQAVHRHFPHRNVSIKLSEKTKIIEVKSGEDILSAAIRHGLNPPYSCKGGICGNCAAKCTSGKVYMSINEVLTEPDLQEGWILTCTGFPETDNVSIDFSET